METTLTLAPKTVPPVPVQFEQRAVSDRKVPKVANTEKGSILPADKHFVAQVVNARLSGTSFPENPGEIVPEERTLRPYGTPMLPSDKPDADQDSQETPDELAGVDTEPTSKPTLSTRADDEAPPEVTEAEEKPRTTENDSPAPRASDSF